jgi:uncharacterized membrane protein
LPLYPVGVDSVIEAMRAMAHGMLLMVRGNGVWMFWNLLLAVIPAALAVALFRPGAPRTAGWWTGVAVFVLFLPNAPYVLTDSIHLFDQIRGTESQFEVIGIVLPVYGAFFCVGFGCYVLALRQVRHYVHSSADGVSWWALALVLHGLCALGVYLGRFFRLNSWSVVSHPFSVVSSLRDLVGAVPVMLIATTFVGLVVLTATSNVVVDAGLSRARVLLHRHR